MTFREVKIAIYATYLTNKYGFKCKYALNNAQILHLRDEYAKLLLNYLNIEVVVVNAQNVPKQKSIFLSNHRSIIDPLIIDLALEPTSLYSVWIAKKELYNSIFFGIFVRNAGTILLNRQSSQMGSFFKEVKEAVNNECSICIFPEGSRNRSNNELMPFKEGARIIALKTRLKIVPFYIRTNTNDILKQSIYEGKKNLKVYIEFGNEIDPKDKTLTLEAAYKKQFKIMT